MAPSFDCCVNASYHTGTPTGTTTKLGKRDCYVTGPETADKAVMMIHDVFGWSLNNTRVLADKYAQGIGARIYLPDFFEGGDIPSVQAKEPGKEPGDIVPGLLEKFPLREPAWKATSEAIKDLKKAQPSAKKIGVMGFCWGATSCVYLGGKNAGEAQVDAVAFAHPSGLQPEDFEQLVKPGLFLTCEHDPMLPAEKREASIKICEKKAKDEGIFTRFSYYPNTSHGWSIKGEERDPYQKRSMQHAASEVVGFFSLELN